MPYRSYWLTPSGTVETDVPESAMPDALSADGGNLWLDFDDLTESDAEFLERVFGLHPVALASCMDSDLSIPKVDDYGGYLFIVSRGIDYTADTGVVSTAELDIFVSANFVVSCHRGLMHSVEAVAALAERGGPPMARGARFLAYTLLDALIENLTPGIEALNDWTDSIEDAVIEQPTRSGLEAILSVKRSCLRLRRAIAPQRDMLARLLRADFEHITGDAQVYYRDVYDSVLRIEAQNANVRDRVDTILAVHLALVANQQNDLMRTLAVVATVFMPLGLVTGIYGMNFEYMPHLGFRWGYYLVVALSVFTIGWALWLFWFRRLAERRSRRLVRFTMASIDPNRLIRYAGKLDPRRIEPRALDPRRISRGRRGEWPKARARRRDERTDESANRKRGGESP